MTEPVSKSMHATICRRLDEIAAEENITILLAIESGSRAWGFHSPDSDYDVRFIYTRPIDWFLTLGKKRDVVERPIDDLLDISGWQLDKALGLAIKGNAVLAEWLQSPIIYRAIPEAHQAVLDFCWGAMQPRPVMWHYLSLAQQHQSRAQTEDGRVRLKRLFYTLRPALSLRWMHKNDFDIPPMDMDSLCAGAALAEGEAEAIAKLIALKIARAEKAVGAAPDALIFSIIDRALDQTRETLKSLPDQPNGSLSAAADRLHIALTKQLS
ncbi:nucleotidyltransferase domain-containing protein [Yoonia sp. 2307UL14-13]|uniref:nucleotidyltransferase domain-containing protein n=1 Tax=Yoonia sp. 2307UL14-13 TaxID=3126506 RepID=UPI0030AA6341